eukprot:gnl/Chilomastix_caulleri/4221.p1 GENE.gnl/Chilomastix_caulleri/4221~~gnl/Chilomastix_caulleri/4221.p1  ORF type:complete len:92 (+),score=3.89 gnl/Chilomastix_caulleri/4221:288-563(+)
MFLRECDLSKSKYHLTGAIIHLGSNLNRGHYITLARIRKGFDVWGLFDDKKVFIVGRREDINGMMGRYFRKNPFCLHTFSRGQTVGVDFLY